MLISFAQNKGLLSLWIKAVNSVGFLFVQHDCYGPSFVAPLFLRPVQKHKCERHTGLLMTYGSVHSFPFRNSGVLLCRSDRWKKGHCNWPPHPVTASLLGDSYHRLHGEGKGKPELPTYLWLWNCRCRLEALAGPKECPSDLLSQRWHRARPRAPRFSQPDPLDPNSATD